MKQFETWWADLPERPGQRPVLLISRNDAYSYLSKFIAVEITSTVRGIASEIPLGDEERIPKVCVANCDSLRMAPRASLTRCAGRLAQVRETEIKRAMGPLWDGGS